MTRAESSIALLADARQGWLNRHGRRWFAKMMTLMERWAAVSAARCQADRYRKHFRSRSHLGLLLYYALKGDANLRQSYTLFESHPNLLARSGLMSAKGGSSVSFSQFTHSNTSSVASSRRPRFRRRPNGLVHSACPCGPPNALRSCASNTSP